MDSALQTGAKSVLLWRRFLRVIPISHKKNLRRDLLKGKEWVSSKGKVEILYLSPEFGSVVNLPV